MADYQVQKNEGKTNLIINYLPQNMTEKELYSMFVTIGPVESCRVMKDFKTGYSYGFGFVNYSKAEDASRAIGTLNGLQVQNKRLKVSFARPSGEEIKETNLYVTNLPRNITEQYLDMLFGKYGQIVQKNLLKDKLTGMPRGVAFVRFDRRDEAQEAINSLNGIVPENGTEPLVVKIAEEHGKQKAAYYAGWQAGYNQSRASLVLYAIEEIIRHNIILLQSHRLLMIVIKQIRCSYLRSGIWYCTSAGYYERHEAGICLPAVTVLIAALLMNSLVLRVVCF
ncbi:sex-lethal homolog isoform X4 [Cryptotermes secundus]|nr:sex-lethal homolog isoform X4 [Cryptotermes secundus]